MSKISLVGPLVSISPTFYEQLFQNNQYKRLLVNCWLNWHLDLKKRASSIVEELSSCEAKKTRKSIWSGVKDEEDDISTQIDHQMFEKITKRRRANDRRTFCPRLDSTGRFVSLKKNLRSEIANGSFSRFFEGKESMILWRHYPHIKKRDNTGMGVKIYIQLLHCLAIPVL